MPPQIVQKLAIVALFAAVCMLSSCGKVVRSVIKTAAESASKGGGAASGVLKYGDDAFRVYNGSNGNN